MNRFVRMLTMLVWVMLPLWTLVEPVNGLLPMSLSTSAAQWIKQEPSVYTTKLQMAPAVEQKKSWWSAVSSTFGITWSTQAPNRRGDVVEDGRGKGIKGRLLSKMKKGKKLQFRGAKRAVFRGGRNAFEWVLNALPPSLEDRSRRSVCNINPWVRHSIPSYLKPYVCSAYARSDIFQRLHAHVSVEAASWKGHHAWSNWVFAACDVIGLGPVVTGLTVISVTVLTVTWALMLAALLAVKRSCLVVARASNAIIHLWNQNLIRRKVVEVARAVKAFLPRRAPPAAAASDQ